MDDQETAEFWDDFAPDYVAAQNESRLPITADLTRYLSQQNILPEASVLDIGGGAGRFALPFAQVARQVTISDISQQMLNFARQVVANTSLTNLKFQHAAWSQLPAQPQADVVFASMLPLAPDELAKFSQLAGHFAVLNRAVTHTDSITTELQQLLELPPVEDPTNDAAIFIAYEKQVQQLGYQPWQRTFTYQLTEQVTQAMLEAELMADLSAPQQLIFQQWLAQRFAQRSEITAQQTYIFKTLIWRV
ncbi:class I SAM-dependent methyltransferase [Loigolactobacillus zhaoyuanensis]|uniref:Class I SAM-dependent methyltransferase n=1 Tax=Loigolactobacillus zhaoyuanensis TaxID=2486017 RepID=A0ABW8UCF7_9LACO|nr:class I SAM-dependent methyltransferase [Loigolactobacillus zhaoyuanensis]